MEFIIVAVMFTPLLLALVAGVIFLVIYAKSQLTKIEINRTRINPDFNGNYPVYFNPKSGTILDTNPGNTRYPAQIFYIGTASGSKQASFRPIEINPSHYKVTEVEPENIEPVRERSTQNERSLSVQPEIYNRLLEAKRGRKGKEKSIKEITGYSKGSSKQYQLLSQVWNEME